MTTSVPYRVPVKRRTREGTLFESRSQRETYQCVHARGKGACTSLM